jgi:hypothetical protein
MDCRGQRTQGRRYEQRADRRGFGPPPYLSYIAAELSGGVAVYDSTRCFY